MKKRALTTRFLALALILIGLAACQSVPAERHNNCSCNWEPLVSSSEGEAV